MLLIRLSTRLLNVLGQIATDWGIQKNSTHPLGLFRPVMGLLYLLPFYIPILFADDASIIVKSSNSKAFETNKVTAFDCVNKLFKVNLLSINVNKTNYIQFNTKNKPTLDLIIVMIIQ
jgi:hypothetical protein